MKKEKTTKQLLGAWVCDLANRLINDCETPMTQSEAFRRAHLARELQENLGQGKVCFQYKKQNGDLREAYGTLRGGIDPEFDAYIEERRSKERRSKHEESLNFTYWDLEKKGFRTFSAARLVKIVAVAIPNYREIENYELHEFHELASADENLFSVCRA